MIRAGTVAREVTPADGAFSTSIPLALGANQINVFAFNADGVGDERVAQRVLALVRDARRRR